MAPVLSAASSAGRGRNERGKGDLDEKILAEGSKPEGKRNSLTARQVRRGVVSQEAGQGAKRDWVLEAPRIRIKDKS